MLHTLLLLRIKERVPNPDEPHHQGLAMGIHSLPYAMRPRVIYATSLLYWATGALAMVGIYKYIVRSVKYII